MYQPPHFCRRRKKKGEGQERRGRKGRYPTSCATSGSCQSKRKKRKGEAFLHGNIAHWKKKGGREKEEGKGIFLFFSATRGKGREGKGGRMSAGFFSCAGFWEEKRGEEKKQNNEYRDPDGHTCKILLLKKKKKKKKKEGESPNDSTP